MSTTCSKCGFENPLGVNVCGNCAAPLARACSICGFENPGNFKFCGNCGSNLLSAPLSRGARAESLQRIADTIPAGLIEKMTSAGKQIEGERRTVTVLFADITGFTTISEKLDPEEVYNLIDSTLKAFIEEIYKHEGTLDKIIGDGLMALFGAPVAHEDDPARAARAALGMQTALRRVNEDLEARLGISLKIRIGLNSGLVVVGSIGSDLRMDYTALGDTVNVASRLQSVAEPGTILASRPVYEQTKPLFEYRELGSIRVKGRVEPVEIFELAALKTKAGRVRGITGLIAPMVGREEELARLRQVVNDLIREEKGRSVLVTGEAGLGKSRLTAEFKNYLADKRVTLLEGACLSYGQSAYGVFLRLLRSYFEIAEEDAEEIVRNKIEQSVRDLLPDAPSVSQVLPYIENLFSIKLVEKELAERVRHLEPAQLQQQTFLAVRDLLRAEASNRPLILVFEDVHWIDKLSLDLLTFLHSSIEEFPLVLYCNSRPAEGAAAPTLRQIGNDLYASRFVYLPLTPLSQADSVALIDLLLSIADLPENFKETIPQRAEGNPFYLEEIIRVLIDRGVIQRSDGHWQMTPDADIANLEVPRTLQGLIMTRVDHLGESARQAIQSAAVIGREFPYKLLTLVLEGVRSLQDDVTELEDREIVNRILEATELEYRFHHVLIQETVYNSLLIRRRERLHQKIAEGIEALFKDRLEEQVERLAFHFTESKNFQQALPYLIRGGKRAADRFANDEALRYYRLAAEALTKVNPTVEQRIQVHSGLGEVQSFIGDYEGALNSYLVALELLRTSLS
ncbi:MAG: AAA family ATPase, partial [Chloroflexi bacterium]|nr:AAA family ATPase [Chloroflexota bacterium]